MGKDYSDVMEFARMKDGRCLSLISNMSASRFCYEVTGKKGKGFSLKIVNQVMLNKILGGSS